MQPVSAAFLAALADDTQVATRVDVCPMNSLAVLATLNLTGGSVTEDETQQIRRTASITLSETALVPADVTDLLHPLAGNELRVYRGLVYPGGASELVPLGVFAPSKPTTTDLGGALSTTVTGKDRSQWLARAVWVQPHAIAAGTALETAIRDVVSGVLGWVTFNMAPSGVTLPASTLGATPGSSNPLADITTLAAASGYEVFFDPLGVFTGRFIPNPTTGAVVAVLTDGDRGTLVQVTRDFDESKAYNGVLVIGNGAATDPVEALVWADYPNPSSFADAVAHSPTPGMPYVFSDSTITSYTQALTTAQTLLPRNSHAVEEVSVQTMPNSALGAGDIVHVHRVVGSRIDNAYAISALTVPLDTATAMNLTCRPQ